MPRRNHFSKRQRQSRRRVRRRETLFNLKSTRKETVESHLKFLPLELIPIVIAYSRTESPVFFGISSEEKFVCYHYDVETGVWTLCGFPREELRDIAEPNMLDVFLRTGKEYSEWRNKWDSIPNLNLYALPNQIFLFSKTEDIAIQYDLKTERETRLNPGFVVGCVLPTPSQLFVIESATSRFYTFQLSTGVWEEGPSLPGNLPGDKYAFLLYCDGFLVAFVDSEREFSFRSIWAKKHKASEYFYALDITKSDQWPHWWTHKCPYPRGSNRVAPLVCDRAIYFYAFSFSLPVGFCQFQPSANVWRALSPISGFQVSFALKWSDFDSMETLFK